MALRRLFMLSVVVVGLLALVVVDQAAAEVRYRVVDLGTLGLQLHPYSYAYGINDNGEVVGRASASRTTYHAFLYDGSMRDLGTLGGQNSRAYSINNNGQVVGETETATDQYRAFLYNGTMHDLGTLGGSYSVAADINNCGQVVGTSSTSSGQVRAFLYDGVMHDLGTLGGYESRAFAVNDSGHVVGEAVTASNYRHAFLYDGTMHDLGTLGGDSYAYGINNVGQVTGCYYVTPGAFDKHAYIYDGTMHDLGTLGGRVSIAHGINDMGYVVGGSGLSDVLVAPHAFLYDGSRMRNLNDLIDPSSGWTLAEATAVNNAGQIVGYGFLPGSNYYRAFRLDPVPEPSSLLALAFGVAGVLAGRRKKGC